MHRRTYLRRVGTGGLAAATVAAPAAAQSNGGETGDGSTGTPTTHTVEMITEGSSYYFDPVGLHVQPGDTVEFVNASGSHSATTYSDGNPKAETNRIPEGADGFHSGTLEAQDAVYTYTFETPGTYDYFCVPHKSLGMVGRIVCGEPGGPATKGSVPDTPGQGLLPPSKKIVKEGSLAYPFVPGGLEPLPWQFWAGTGVFGVVVTYLLSKYDRESGRYSAEYADNQV